MTDQPSDHGGMTDEELDQLLAAANRELLEHIQRVADPDAPLTAIMALNARDRGDETSAAVQAIAIRARAAHVVDIVARARANALVLALASILDRAHDNASTLVLVLALASDLASGLDSASDLNFVRSRALALALDIEGALANNSDDLARSRALARALDHALRCDHNYGRAHDLANDLVRDLDRARARTLTRASAHDLASDVSDARALVLTLASALGGASTRSLALALGRASALDRDYPLKLADILASAYKLASDLARGLVAQQVNAAGADLSGMEIERVEILEGVTWTDQTRWPPGIKELVREASEEIGDGVYQVRTGDTPDRSYVTLM